MSVTRIITGVSFDSNVWLLKGRSCVLVDTGTGLSRCCVGNLRDALAGSELSSVVLTHCHADHVGGLDGIVREFGCQAYIGRNDAVPLMNADGRITCSDYLGVRVRPCPGVIGLSEGDVFDIGEHRLTVIETPGHTKGSICLYDGVTQSLFSGDTVFAHAAGRMDLPTGSPADMTASLRKLSNVNIKQLYPGHGPSSDDGNASVEDAMRSVGS